MAWWSRRRFGWWGEVTYDLTPLSTFQPSSESYLTADTLDLAGGAALRLKWGELRLGASSDAALVLGATFYPGRKR